MFTVYRPLLPTLRQAARGLVAWIPLRWAWLILLPACLRAAILCDTPGWQQTDGLRGFDGTVRATILWDRDGPDGNPPVLVAAGNFSLAGTTFARSIALWNGQAWEPLGSGAQGEVYSLGVDRRGDLIVGGTFREAGGVVVNNIARWNGQVWTNLGTGMAAIGAPQVNALTTLPNGDLVAGGYFSTAGGTPVSGIARWDGTTWTALGGGFSGVSGDPPIVSALRLMADGGLIAAGNFQVPGGPANSNVARWDGTQWIGLGYVPSVRSLTVLGSGDLVAGGAGVFRWDGVAWSVVGSLQFGKSLAAGVWALAILPNGDLAAGGAFWTKAGGPADFVARWDGAAWVALGSGFQNFVNTLTILPGGQLVAGGDFIAAGGVHASHLARWDGVSWNPYGSGIGSIVSPASPVSVNVYALQRMPNGDVVAGGSFAAAGEIAANNIARWNGTGWSPLGLGTSGEVRALAVAPNGDLIAGGTFKKAGDVAVNNLARWDGRAWAPIGTGVDGVVTPVVHSLAVAPDGQITAGGSFMTAGGAAALRIARWTGSNWVPLGTGMNGIVTTISYLPNGDVIAGGEFRTAGGIAANNIARWDGLTWSPLGAGLNSGVFSVARLPGGDLIVGGRFSIAGGGPVSGPLARWNGTNWSAFSPRPGGTVNALAVLPNGNIVVAGQMSGAGTVTTSGVMIWDQNQWLGLGTGTSSTTIGYNAVNAVAALPDGGFVMGGSFIKVSGIVSPFFAHWGCPMSSASAPPTLTGDRIGPFGMKLTLRGTTGKTYRIEHAPNLPNWQPVQRGLVADAVFEDANEARTGAAQGYYRAVQE